MESGGLSGRMCNTLRILQVSLSVDLSLLRSKGMASPGCAGLNHVPELTGRVFVTLAYPRMAQRKEGRTDKA